MSYVQCRDGFNMSVKASHGHYCSPREDNPPSGYTHYEVGYPSESESLLLSYKEMECDMRFPPTESVYCDVPKEVIQHIIAKHGGLLLDNDWQSGSPEYWLVNIVARRVREVRARAESEEPRILQGHQDGGIGIACAQGIESSDVARTINSDELEMFMENLSNTLEENTI